MNLINNTFKSHIKTARIFFIISAIYGLVLRLYSIVDVPITYKNILQAHSHVTFLGWGFLAVISLVGFVYYPKKLEKSKYLKRLFSIMTLTLVGMLISFPIQGYKVFSIVLLSVFLITSYVYLISILKELKSVKNYSAKFIKTGVFYYFLSSIAIWAIAYITIKFGKTDLYYNSIYFYLHFLYNGFFVFMLFGLLIKYFEDKQLIIEQKHVKYFYLFTNLACVPAYALSLLWSEVSSFVYYIGFFAGFLQLISLFYLYKLIKVFLKSLNTKHIKFVAIFVMTSYFIKVCIQFLSVFPIVIEKAVQFKPYFIIGYLHLFTLGFMSLFIILLLLIHPKIKLDRFGLNILIAGIFLSEFFLFFQGILSLFQKGINQINLILFVVSSLMPIGILIIHFRMTNKSKSNELL